MNRKLSISAVFILMLTSQIAAAALSGIPSTLSPFCHQNLEKLTKTFSEVSVPYLGADVVVSVTSVSVPTQVQFSQTGLAEINVSAAIKAVNGDGEESTDIVNSVISLLHPCFIIKIQAGEPND